MGHANALPGLAGSNGSPCPLHRVEFQSCFAVGQFRGSSRRLTRETLFVFRPRSGRRVCRPAVRSHALPYTRRPVGSATNHLHRHRRSQLQRSHPGQRRAYRRTHSPSGRGACIGFDGCNLPGPLPCQLPSRIHRGTSSPVGAQDQREAAGQLAKGCGRPRQRHGTLPDFALDVYAELQDLVP